MKNSNNTSGLAAAPALKKKEPGILREIPTVAVVELYEELFDKLFDKKRERGEEEIGIELPFLERPSRLVVNTDARYLEMQRILFVMSTAFHSWRQDIKEHLGGEETFYQLVAEIAKSSPLKSTRILDLSAEKNPPLANICRALGATAFTAGKREFESDIRQKIKSSPQEKIERMYHVNENTVSKEDLLRIMSDGPRFDLITETAINGNMEERIERVNFIVNEMLTPGGIYFHPFHGDVRRNITS